MSSLFIQERNAADPRPLFRTQMSIDANNFIEKHFRPVFDHLERETGSDRIPISVFKEELERNKRLRRILRKNPPEEVVQFLYEADLNKDDHISYEEFIKMHREPRMDGNLASLMVKLLRIAIGSMSTNEDKMEQKIIKWSPREIFLRRSIPLFSIIMSIAQILIFLSHLIHAKFHHDKMLHDLTYSYLIFSPDKKIQLWRLVTYSLLHRSYLHLIPNMIIQLMCGMPLEIVHGTRSVVFIYFFGILAGSLGVNLFNPSVYLLGSSGGIYALFAAYFAYFIMNYSKDDKVSKIVLFSMFAVPVFNLIDFLVYQKSLNKISVFCHLFGALSGFLMGFVVYKNSKHKYGTYLQIIALVIHLLVMTGMTIYYMKHFAHMIVSSQAESSNNLTLAANSTEINEDFYVDLF